MQPTPQIVVIGLGNTLRGDDAVGRLAAQRVRRATNPGRVRVIDQVAITPELAAEIAGASLAIFLDASVDGPPDRVQTTRITPREPAPSMAHRLDVHGVAYLAEQLYGKSPEVLAITFRGQDFAVSDQQLSPAAATGLEELVSETLCVIASRCPTAAEV